KKPEDRFASAADFVRELEHIAARLRFRETTSLWSSPALSRSIADAQIPPERSRREARGGLVLLIALASAAVCIALALLLLCILPRVGEDNKGPRAAHSAEGLGQARGFSARGLQASPGGGAHP